VSEFIADASAILAFARGESGHERVGEVRDRCVVSTVNMMEALSRLLRYDLPAESVQTFLRETFPRTVDLDRDLAETSAVLHATTRSIGLSYPDCICLALGSRRNATVLTADRRWREVSPNIAVELIR
jgi:PIN domain nuclease of toxin-antitoxin system